MRVKGCLYSMLFPTRPNNNESWSKRCSLEGWSFASPPILDVNRGDLGIWHGHPKHLLSSHKPVRKRRDVETGGGIRTLIHRGGRPSPHLSRTPACKRAGLVRGGEISNIVFSDRSLSPCSLPRLSFEKKHSQVLVQRRLLDSSFTSNREIIPECRARATKNQRERSKSNRKN